MSDFEDDDGVPALSSEALLALEEFYNEQKARDTEKVDDIDWHKRFREDWQLSQFWYDEETVDKLSNEAQSAVSETGSIALISCPTLYFEIKKKCPKCEVILFEFDKRFAALGNDFNFYNYENPLEISQSYANHFDLVIADPPFLSEECLTKTALTMRFLSKSKLIVCTGSIMENLAVRLLGVKKTSFNPRHKNNLSNEFSCFTNYEDNFDKL
ncbi:unnamed protein product [Nesidiocoris tenuis]|uniref:Protein-lysine N-methyltransferase NTEN_LOCUS19114 n=1 Tax=Nesidiocoris tenuis TaxID=355587 RepID=A0A6H5HAL3_9HEMI|nr:unnamed protein product [Nesidiocoris tenuis]